MYTKLLFNNHGRNMKFKDRQKVLCVDDHFNYGQSRLKKGLVYTIDGFYRCSCGSNQVTLVEIPDVLSMRCKCHWTSIRRQSYYNWRFRSARAS